MREKKGHSGDRLKCSSLPGQRQKLNSFKDRAVSKLTEVYLLVPNHLMPIDKASTSPYRPIPGLGYISTPHQPSANLVSGF